MTRWQPISTAPKDGTWVFVYSPKWPITCYPLVGWSDGPGEEWQFPAHPQWASDMPYPTHWQSLPAPPSAEPQPMTRDEAMINLGYHGPKDGDR